MIFTEIVEQKTGWKEPYGKWIETNKSFVSHVMGISNMLERYGAMIMDISYSLYTKKYMCAYITYRL